MAKDVRINITANGGQASKEIDTIQGKLHKLMGTKLGSVLDKGVMMAGAAGLAMGFERAVRSIAELTDRMSGLKARIDLMNDGLQTNVQLLKDIKMAANNSRGSYLDMADSVSKLGILAGNAFSSNKEMVDFVEQLNKQFKISGASLQESTAAMYQLTQAMASGKLQGDEFRSILENAPMLAQAISKEMGVPMGQLRELSSQGAITADIIKNALMNSAEETNAKFEQMPMTFGDAMTILQNNAIEAFQPVMEMLGSITQSDAFRNMVQGATTAFKILGDVVRGIGQIISGTFSIAGQAIRAILTIANNLFQIFKAGYQVIIPVMALWIGYQKQDLAMMILRKAAIVAFAPILVGLKVAQLAYMGAVNATYIAQAAYNTVTKATMAIMATLRGATLATATVTGVLRGAVALLTGGFNLLKLAILSNPIAWLCGLLGVLAAAFVAPTIASKGLSQTISDIWNSIVHSTAWGVNQAIKLINKLIDAFNWLGEKMNAVLKIDVTKINHIDEIDPQVAEDFSNRVQEGISSLTAAVGGGGVDVGAMGGAVGGGGGGAGGRMSEAENAYNKLAEKAKETHDSIEKEWKELYLSKTALADEWYNQELAKLNETKEANNNYADDLKKLNAIYDDKRAKAWAEEAEEVENLNNKVKELSDSLNSTYSIKDSTGNISPMAKLVEEQADAESKIRTMWQQQAIDYAKMSESQQETFKRLLAERGIAYQLDSQNKINFDAVANAQVLASNAEFEQKRNQLAREGAEERWAIDEAIRTGNLEALQQTLDSEEMAYAQHYENLKEQLAEYVEAHNNAHFSMADLQNNLINTSLDSLKNSISGMLQGVKTVQDAFKALGQIMLKTISDYVANYLTSLLKTKVLESSINNTKKVEAKATAAAIQSAFTPAAMARSIADAGPFAGPALFASAMGTATAMSGLTGMMGNMSSLPTLQGKFNMPMMASGGLVDSPTVAMIGEGKYPEAVVPLSEDVFNKMGEGINNSGAGNSITLNVSAIDAHGFESWLRNKGGRVLSQYFGSERREFRLEGGII